MTNKPVQIGAQDVSVTLRAFLASTGLPATSLTHASSGLELRYMRGEDGTVTTITPVTQTSTGAHTDGGFVHKHGGLYRVDLPDAAVASGSPSPRAVYVTAAGVADTVFSVAQLTLTEDDPNAEGVTPEQLEESALDLFDTLARTNTELTVGPRTWDVTPNAALQPIGGLTPQVP